MDARISAVATKQPEGQGFSLRNKGKHLPSLAYGYVSLLESVLCALGSSYCVTTSA